MRRNRKYILLLLLAAVILIQFFHPAKNKSATSNLSPGDISKLYTIPDSVQGILQTSCYDCHSNNTSYPWYSKIQPVDWWLNNHIINGKRALNFNEFAGYAIGKQYKKLEDIAKAVKDNYMPLNSYLWIHKDAILTASQKTRIVDWVTVIRDSIKSGYPADSLVQPNRHE